jgi:urease alpha subunit
MTGAPGGQAGLVTLDAGGNPKTQESLTLGIGIPSAPIITNGRIYTSSSVNSQDIFVIRTPLWDTTGNIRAWREIF